MIVFWTGTFWTVRQASRRRCCLCPLGSVNSRWLQRPWTSPQLVGVQMRGAAESHMPPCDCCDTQRRLSDAHWLLWWGQILTASLFIQESSFVCMHLLSFFSFFSPLNLSQLWICSVLCSSVGLCPTCHWLRSYSNNVTVERNVRFVRLIKQRSQKILTERKTNYNVAVF